MTDEGSFFDADRVHEGIYIGGEVVGRVAAFGLISVPVPALGEREGVVGGREQGEHPTEGEPRVGVPVQEDDRFPCSIASLFGVVEPHPLASWVERAPDRSAGESYSLLPSPNTARRAILTTRQYDANRRS
jgi:hypothetical protein